MQSIQSTKSTFFYFFLAICICFIACKDDDPVDPDPIPDPDPIEDTLDVVEDTINVVWDIEVGPNAEDDAQTAMILMDDFDPLKFAAGVFDITGTLSMIDKQNVVIIGAGMNETILEFSNQATGTGAEGIKIDNVENAIIANLSVKNTVGDGIKVKDSKHFTFYQVNVEWDAEVSPDNGAYGLYPVLCEHVLIDGCRAKGAADAGLYIGQCTNAIVKNSIAEYNVAGIEIENTINAEVFNCTANNNTGGILVFDLPGLTQYGSHCRVYDNVVTDNSTQNVATGGTVAAIPPGTGIMMLSAHNVEIFDNEVVENNVMGVGIINYLVLELFGLPSSGDDELFDPYPRGIYVHNNSFSSSDAYPPISNDIGNILTDQFPNGALPDLLIDGYVPSEGPLVGDERICFDSNGTADFTNVDASSFFANPVTDISVYECMHTPLAAVTVIAPTLE